jgi:hypothetical protein
MFGSSFHARSGRKRSADRQPGDGALRGLFADANNGVLNQGSAVAAAESRLRIVLMGSGESVSPVRFGRGATADLSTDRGPA